MTGGRFKSSDMVLILIKKPVTRTGWEWGRHYDQFAASICAVVVMVPAAIATITPARAA